MQDGITDMFVVNLEEEKAREDFNTLMRKLSRKIAMKLKLIPQMNWLMKKIQGM